MMTSLKQVFSVETVVPRSADQLLRNLFPYNDRMQSHQIVEDFPSWIIEIIKDSIFSLTAYTHNLLGKLLCVGLVDGTKFHKAHNHLFHVIAVHVIANGCHENRCDEHSLHQDQ